MKISKKEFFFCCYLMGIMLRRTSLLMDLRLRSTQMCLKMYHLFGNCTNLGNHKNLSKISTLHKSIKSTNHGILTKPVHLSITKWITIKLSIRYCFYQKLITLVVLVMKTSLLKIPRN